ncbi:hypothetical protein PVK06_011338 [Gossypium arboreum]|uniref:Uncharacterized protein n=1 Tax=Gossypium arboreum TaxID=29729 RepID=A0ABR0Q8K4_GOSAR|nr:hypothetical protein PVK06_011338 [Gossypium arboreum]
MPMYFESLFFIVSCGVDRFGILVLELPPNQYRPMQFFEQAGAEEWEEEEEEQEESAHDKDFNDVFRLEQPTIRGVKIHTPSRTNLTNSAGARVGTSKMGQGMELMIEENWPQFDSY